MSEPNGERVPGYSFTDPSGEVITVPAGRCTEAATYTNESMSRAEASDIMIAFGLVTGCKYPIERRASGPGYNAIVPMEVIRNMPAVKAILEKRKG